MSKYQSSEGVTVIEGGIPHIQLEIPRWAMEMPIAVGVTRRLGGVSQGDFAGLNMSFHVGDQPENVRYNRSLVARYLGCPVEELVCAEQVHGLESVRVTSSMKGKGALSLETAIPHCDALYTNETEVPLLIQIADCAPVLLYDAKHHAIAAIHAGWRGVYGELPQKTLYRMQREFKTAPEDVWVYVGPHIGVDSFEVDASLANQFVMQFGELARQDTYGGKPHVNLTYCIAKSLKSVGVPELQMTMSPYDSMTTEECFSYRAENGSTGRMALVAMLHRK